MTEGELFLTEEAIGRALRRLAVSIVDETTQAGATKLALVGIQRGGVPLAEGIAREVKAAEDRDLPIGMVDIGLYRDDAATAFPDSKIAPSSIPFPVEGCDVVLVDDVLQTGRTVRAAIDHLLDYGRPRRVWLAVLLDRGGRELPIAPEFVGRTIEVARGAKVRLVLDEDGRPTGARVEGTPGQDSDSHAS